MRVEREAQRRSPRLLCEDKYLLSSSWGPGESIIIFGQSWASQIMISTQETKPD